MIQDIEAGFLPSTKTLIFNLKRFAAQAPMVMLFVAVFSVPLSSLAFAAGLKILYTVAEYLNCNLGESSVARLLLRWVRGVLFTFLPVMILQALLITAYFFSIGAFSSNSESLLRSIWFLFARAATGIPFILGLGLIAAPFLAWMIWSTRRRNEVVAANLQAVADGGGARLRTFG
jgi:hypothetical protein